MTKEEIRVLLVEDSAEDAELILGEMERAGFRITMIRVTDAGALSKALDEGPWDIVLADYHLPGFDAFEALEVLAKKAPELPCVVISGLVGEESAVALMRAGARDFVYKDKMGRLGEVLRRELREAGLRAEEKQTRARLRLSEEKARIIVENSVQAMVVIDRGNGRILDTNPAFHGMLGFSPEESKGMVFADLVADSLRETAISLLRNVQPALVLSRPLEVKRADQTLCFTDMTAVVIPWGEESAIFVTLVDASERKRGEERVARQLHRISALRKIDLAITGSLDLQVALNIILDQIVSLLDVDAASVLLFNPTLQLLEFSAGRGFQTDALRFTKLRMGDGYAGRAALARKLLQIPDLRSATGELKRSKDLRAEGFVSYWAVPLIAKGMVRGVVEIFTRKFKPVENEWLEFLETLAGQTAIAVESASTFEELQRSNAELEVAYDATLEGWSHALDLRDKETEGHTERVTLMTVALARAMGVPEPQIKNIRRGALLHDIGKLGIPDSILLKPGPLSEEEWEVMKKHPVYAHQWLSPILYLRPALDIPWCHHEKYDGSGYPRGLRGETIPMAARIFAVVDVYDALTSDRPYRKAWSRERALDHITTLAGSHFDPKVVDEFLRMQV